MGGPLLERPNAARAAQAFPGPAPPPIRVAAIQPATYNIAAQKGIGVLAFSSHAPSTQTGHIKEYKANEKYAEPVGAFINDQWTTSPSHDNEEAQMLAAQAI